MVAEQVVADVRMLLHEKKKWIGCYEWQADNLGKIWLIDEKNCGNRALRPLELPAITQILSDTPQEADEPGDPSVIMYIRLEPSVYMPDIDIDDPVERVFNINNVDMDERLRGRGFFKGFISTLEAWSSTDEACNCLLVQNICNMRLLSHLAGRSPAWRSPDAVHQQRDIVCTTCTTFTPSKR